MQTTLLPAGSPSSAAIRNTLERLIQSLQYAETGLQRDKLAFLSDTFLMLSALTNWTIEESTGELHGKEASENEVSLAATMERELRSASAADRSLEERIGIEKMASRLGYSPAYCNRVFQRVYGMSPPSIFNRTHHSPSEAAADQYGTYNRRHRLSARLSRYLAIQQAI